MAGDATVEPGDIAEVVVDRELREPDLIDAERAVEGVENGELKERFARIGGAILEGLRQLPDLVAVVGESLGRGILGRCDVAEDGLEALAVGVGNLIGLSRLDHLCLLRLGDREQRVEAVLRCPFGNGQLVIGAALIELSLPELETSGKVVLAELGPLGDVAHPLNEVATDRKTLALVGLRNEAVDVGLDQIRRHGVFVDRSGLLKERRRQRRVDRRAAGVGKRRLEFCGFRRVGVGAFLCHAGRRRPCLQISEALLVLLPRSVVIGCEHGDRRQQQHDRRDAEHDVQLLQVPPSLFCGRHENGSGRRRPAVATRDPTVGRSTALEVERELRNADQIPQIQRPAEDHFQWQREHQQHEIDHHQIAHEAHLGEVLAKHRHGEKWRENEQISGHDEQARSLAEKNRADLGVPRRVGGNARERLIE